MSAYSVVVAPHIQIAVRNPDCVVGYEIAPDHPWQPDDFVSRGVRLTHVGQAVHEWVGLLLGR